MAENGVGFLKNVEVGAYFVADKAIRSGLNVLRWLPRHGIHPSVAIMGISILTGLAISAIDASDAAAQAQDLGVGIDPIQPLEAAQGQGVEACNNTTITCSFDSVSMTLDTWHNHAPIDSDQVYGNMAPLDPAVYPNGCPHDENIKALLDLRQPDLPPKPGAIFVVDQSPVDGKLIVCVMDKQQSLQGFGENLSRSSEAGAGMAQLPAEATPVETPEITLPGKPFEIKEYVWPALGAVLGIGSIGLLGAFLINFLGFGSDPEGRAMEERLVKTDADALVWGQVRGKLSLPAGASGISAIIVNETVENGTRMVTAKVGQIIPAGETFAFDFKTVSYVHMPENDFFQTRAADLVQEPNILTDLPAKY